jgi:hypothetical protein
MTVLADWKRALMALYPPGAFSRNPSSLHGVLAEADAKVLFAGAQVVEQLEGEPFPSSAIECLDDWEAVYRAPHAPGATTAQRQAALVARWRGGMPFTLAGVRAIVADLLNPEYAWRDPHSNSLVDWRFTQTSHGGTITETASLNLAVAGAVDARWDATHKLGVMCLLPLIVEDGGVTTDDFWFSAKMGATTSSDGLVGVCLYQDDQNAQWWGHHTIGGVDRIRKSWICGNALGGPEDVTVRPAPPYWLTIGRVAGVTRVYLDAALPSPFAPTALAEKGACDVPFHPRQAGLVIWNDGATAQSGIVVETRLAYRLKHHNVEIAETCLAILAGASDVNRFFCFIRRPVLDYGAGDLPRAALELDRFKPGHINLTVGETSTFLTDDSHSLTDRDVLGI